VVPGDPFPQRRTKVPDANLVRIRQQPYNHPAPLHPAPLYAILSGDIELTRTALSVYGFFGSFVMRQLFEGKRPQVWETGVRLLPRFGGWNGGEINDPNPTMMAVLSGNARLLKVVLNIRTRETVGRNSPRPVGIDELRMARIPGLEHPVLVSSVALVAYEGCLDMVRLLVEAGASVDWSCGGIMGNLEGQQFFTYQRIFEWGSQGSEVETNGWSILPSICNWGVSLEISQQQQAGRLDVLRYLIDHCHLGDVVGHAFELPETHLRVAPDCVHGISISNLPTGFTPLWYMIWAGS